MTPAAGLRRLLLVMSLLALAVPAAGCGGGGSSGSDTKSTTEWVDGLCSAINTWNDSVRSAAQSLSGGNLSKQSLESAASDVDDATNTLKDDLDHLGKPDTESGTKAKESVDELSSNIDQGVDKIDSTVKDVSNVQEAVNALSSVTQTFATMATQVSSTFDELKQLDPQGELDRAIENSSSCSRLTSGQG